MGYLFAAYTIILVATFAYIFFMFCRQRRLRGEIDFLKESEYFLPFHEWVFLRDELH